MKLTDLPLDRPVATVMVLLCLTVLGAVAVAPADGFKRMLAGGAVVYTAPVVASFALDPAGRQNAPILQGN